MNKLAATLKAVYTSPRARKDVYDLVKIVAGVVLAHFGIKLA